EFKHLAQPVKAIAFKNGVLQIRNKQDFATLDWIRADWELKVSGKTIAHGTLPTLKTAPQKSEKLKLRLPALALQSGEEAFLNVRFTTSRETAWCEAGHLVGWDQIALAAKKTMNAPTKSSARPEQPLAVQKNGSTLTIGNDT